MIDPPLLHSPTMEPMATRGLPLPGLRRCRVMRLMTQKALAQASGVSRNTIARIENGAKPAELSTVAKLAAALGVDPTALLTA
jgi:transcriptional regulator with XRE-family HTH domain